MNFLALIRVKKNLTKLVSLWILSLTKTWKIYSKQITKNTRFNYKSNYICITSKEVFDQHIGILVYVKDFFVTQTKFSQLSTKNSIRIIGLGEQPQNIAIISPCNSDIKCCILGIYYISFLFLNDFTTRVINITLIATQNAFSCSAFSCSEFSCSAVQRSAVLIYPDK